MATMDYTDPNVQSGGDWFTQNAPVNQNPYFDPSTNITPGQDIPLAGTQPQSPTSSATSGGSMDDAAILAQIGKWAAMPGADPTLANDPQYYLRRIKETGGLRADNLQYWQDASVGPTAFFNNPNREQQGGTSRYGTPEQGQFGSLPTWQGGDYQPLSAEQFRATPGYQSGLDAGTQAIERSAAARGTVLNGGTQKALTRYAGDYADQKYQTYDQNAFRNYQSRYGQFRDTVGDTRNQQVDLWGRLNDLYSTGATAANNSYKPGVIS